MGANPLGAAGNGASLGQPFNNDDAATQVCLSELSNDEDMAAAEEAALNAIWQAETQVGDDYDAAEEQAGVEFMLESHVPPARQLLPHTKTVKRGQGPVERALLSAPASPSYSPPDSPLASPAYSPQASPQARRGPTG